MKNLSFVAMQRRLSVLPDGVVGKYTLSALFKRMGATAAIADELGLAASVHLRKYGVLAAPSRFAHFIAQLAHESGNFLYMEEIASGAAYEGRKDLGNINQGDGKRYKGRGPIQLTGRANYRKYGQALGFDFERHPEMVAIPSVGLLVACEYWTQEGLNELADQDNINLITRRINGGLNGLADRVKKLELITGLMSA